LERDILVNLLQYLNLNNASGVLRLQTALGSQGEVFTVNGQVIHASTPTASGMEALVTLLRWDQGRFSFQASVDSPTRTIDKPLDALLLEVAYLTDVSVGSGESLKGSSVLSPVLSPSATRTGESVALPLSALQILPLLDSATNLSSIAKRLELTPEDVLTAAEAIVQAGLARPQSSANVAPEFIHSLTLLMRDIMGPLADIVMDETLFDLNLSTGPVPQDQLPALLEALGQELSQDRSDWRESFDSQVDELLRRHGLRLQKG
jgi:hypothetical protein